MTIDWSKEVCTDEATPRPVRVLATDRPNPARPIVGMRDDGALFTFDQEGRGNPHLYGNEYGPITLRNVAPVLRSGWIVAYRPHGSKSEWSAHGVFDDEDTCRVFIARHGWDDATPVRIAWNSDGSPVEEEAVDGRSWRGMYFSMMRDRDAWKAKAEDLEAEVDALRSRDRDLEVLHHHHGLAMVGKDVEIAKLREELDKARTAAARAQPVTDAAVVWERHFSSLAGDRLVAAVRAYQPATSDSHEAMVDTTLGVMKTCGTCRWNDSRSVCGAKDCLGSVQDYRGWEAKL